MRSFYDICVIGFGPAGMGCCYKLKDIDKAWNVLVLEAGPSIASRSCTIMSGRGCKFVQPCQLVSGVGGSAVVSGGKLSRFPASSGLATFLGGNNKARSLLDESLAYIRRFLPVREPAASVAEIDTLTAAYRKAGLEFRYYDALEYSSAQARDAFGKIERELVGGKIDLEINSPVEDLRRRPDGTFEVLYKKDLKLQSVSCGKVIVATGRMGRTLLQTISSQLGLASREEFFEVGVRIEIPAELWESIDRVHKDLKVHLGNYRTFCVCKNGILAPYWLGDYFILDGHAEPNGSSGYTNFAIMQRLTCSAHQASGQVFDRLLQAKKSARALIPIREPLLSFIGRQDDRPLPPKVGSSITFWRDGKISSIYPEHILQGLRSGVADFVGRLMTEEQIEAASAFAPVLDYYWGQVQFGEDMSTSIAGLFVAGDATGRFRGILQAMASGLGLIDEQFV